MSSSTSPPPLPARRRPYAVIIVVAAVLSLVVTAYVTFLFGHVSGAEFCPETFERRSFRYIEIPLLGWQVTPIEREPVSGLLEPHLRKNKYVAKVPNPQWDLIYAVQRASVHDPRGASILIAYLDASSPGVRSVWETWSINHPALAARLWPEVAQLARRRLYVLVPDVMQFARAHSEADGAEFAQGLRQLLARRYAELADVVELTDAAEARQLKDWSQAYLSAADKQAQDSTVEPR